jgi:hypothetical protein
MNSLQRPIHYIWCQRVAHCLQSTNFWRRYSALKTISCEIYQRHALMFGRVSTSEHVDVIHERCSADGPSRRSDHCTNLPKSAVYTMSYKSVPKSTVTFVLDACVLFCFTALWPAYSMGPSFRVIFPVLSRTAFSQVRGYHILNGVRLSLRRFGYWRKRSRTRWGTGESASRVRDV